MTENPRVGGSIPSLPMTTTRQFNAIAWVTPDPEHPGKFLRDHHKPGNRERHQAFLDVVEGTHRQKEIMDWFKTMPL